MRKIDSRAHAHLLYCAWLRRWRFWADITTTSSSSSCRAEASDKRILLTLSSVSVVSSFYRPVASAAQVRLLEVTDGIDPTSIRAGKDILERGAVLRNRGAGTTAILVFEVLAARQWWKGRQQPTTLLLKRTVATQSIAIDRPCDTPAVCTRAYNYVHLPCI